MSQSPALSAVVLAAESVAVQNGLRLVAARTSPGQDAAAVHAHALELGRAFAALSEREPQRAAALHGPRLHAELQVPNFEVSLALRRLFDDHLDRGLGGEDRTTRLCRALLSGDTTSFEHLLEALLLATLSYHDTAGRQPEAVYQAFVLGLLVRLEATHVVNSNRESATAGSTSSSARAAPVMPASCSSSRSSTNGAARRPRPRWRRRCSRCVSGRTPPRCGSVGPGWCISSGRFLTASGLWWLLFRVGWRFWFGFDRFDA